MKIKVCGMKYAENIREVAKLKPDYMGFIFYEKSTRNFTGEIPEISSEIKKTGVFVNATTEFIVEKVKQYHLDALQLHGEESGSFCNQLKSKLPSGVEVIKVFSVKEDIDFQLLNDYEGIVDYFLFDTKGKNKGGNGITFNWENLRNYPSTTPFILSGGIGIEEISRIKEFKKHLEENSLGHLLYAVDLNSRFETEPGRKNSATLKIFMNQISSPAT
ncbi:phosphoribosylanthranilate isomerase [Antarcticibacterium flavum]|uniref:N-(5'-phosphoribosyl)anthranilate isomerase n=1 Tax=Antarcticibacterium flavum TaxID=2058175 RepID=A0A5B7X708_9FLAO|nr:MULTISPECIES: phosphoribosylanthranilate isomerase [Antarcticibacterium]MCM4159984.1 N-(5'-phosphoribosyl)anthranilate isomerase [Antarcticibacterium sp. W02-3]QCY70423.1 phosphoribosylanthranilate isomerase [Antarcticibacterium flavum]